MQPMMITVSGAEKLTAPHEAKQVWFKTLVRREGSKLIANTYIVHGGEVQFMKTEVELTPILQALAARHAQINGLNSFRVGAKSKGGKKKKGGLFGGIARLAQKIGKSKLIKGVVGAVKKVSQVAGKVGKWIIKSPIIKGIVAVAAVVYPPIGVPAAAALAAANVALTAIEKAKKIAKKIVHGVESIKVVKNLKAKLGGAVKKFGKEHVKKVLTTNPQIRAVVASAKTGEANMKILRANKAEVLKIATQAKAARQLFKQVAEAARFEKDPVKRDQARKFARVVKIAAQTRAIGKGIAEKNSGGLPGVFIDAQGRMVKGAFTRTLKRSKKTTPSGFVYQGGDGKITRGIFTRQNVTQARRDQDTREAAAKKQAAGQKSKATATAKGKAVIETRKHVAKARQAVQVAQKAKIVANAANKRDVARAKATIAKTKGKMKTEDRKKLAGALAKKIQTKQVARREVINKVSLKAKAHAKAASHSAKKVTGKKTAKVAGWETLVGCDCATRIGYDCIQI